MINELPRLERKRQRVLPVDNPLKLPEYGRLYPRDEFADAAQDRIDQLQQKELMSGVLPPIASDARVLALHAYDQEVAFANVLHAITYGISQE